MNKIIEKTEEELKKLFPPFLYFFIALHIVAVVRILMLHNAGLSETNTITIGMAALILGKAVLLGDMLPFIDRYPHKPMIHNIAWKSIIYGILAVFIHYLERLIEAWKATGSFVAGNEKLSSEFAWQHALAISILLIVMVLIYSTMSELIRVLGKEQVKRMFFGPVDKLTH